VAHSPKFLRGLGALCRCSFGEALVREIKVLPGYFPIIVALFRHVTTRAKSTRGQSFCDSLDEIAATQCR
jgi:hypothetical protein